MANHLVIGLGGTGGSVLRALRKRIYEEFRSNDPKGSANIEYLSLIPQHYYKIFFLST